MSDDGQAFLTGVAMTAFFTFLFFQVVEGACQQKHDVADCEWSQSPFTPTVPEARK